MKDIFFLTGVLYILFEVYILCNSKAITRLFVEHTIKRIGELEDDEHIPTEHYLNVISKQFYITWLILGMFAYQWELFLIILFIKVFESIAKRVIKTRNIEALIQLSSITSLILIQLLIIRHFFPGKI